MKENVFNDTVECAVGGIPHKVHKLGYNPNYYGYILTTLDNYYTATTLWHFQT